MEITASHGARKHTRSPWCMGTYSPLPCARKMVLMDLLGSVQHQSVQNWGFAAQWISPWNWLKGRAANGRGKMAGRREMEAGLLWGKGSKQKEAGPLEELTFYKYIVKSNEETWRKMGDGSELGGHQWPSQRAQAQEEDPEWRNLSS